MYRFTSIKYCTTTALVAALLTVFGLGSYWMGGKWIANALNSKGSIIQLFDGLLLALTALIAGPMLLVAGIIAGFLFDLIITADGSLSLAILPATIIIRILVFMMIRIFMTTKWYSCFWTFFIALLPILLLYPLYTLYLNGPAAAIMEIIINCIQCGASYVLGIGLYWQLNRIQIRSNNGLWNDEQFKSYKKCRIQSI